MVCIIRKHDSYTSTDPRVIKHSHHLWQRWYSTRSLNVTGADTDPTHCISSPEDVPVMRHVRPPMNFDSLRSPAVNEATNEPQLRLSDDRSGASRRFH